MAQPTSRSPLKESVSTAQERRQLWNGVYDARAEHALPWNELRPHLSMQLIGKHARPGDAIIDVGGGASRLVDNLLKAGLGPLGVLDVSERALEIDKARLSGKAAAVDWIAEDITRWTPASSYCVWHDRAMFHFLTAPEDREAYARAMLAALRSGGVAIIATFSQDGPETCSGLTVQRYSPADLKQRLERLLPGALRLIEARHHVHITPKGNRQAFQTSVFRRTA